MKKSFFASLLCCENSENNEGNRLRNKFLQSLHTLMEHMGVADNYEAWKETVKQGKYAFFASWMEQRGEVYLSKICHVDLDDTISDELLDSLDDAIFSLEMASEIDDPEVLCADIADALHDLAKAIERYAVNCDVDAFSTEIDEPLYVVDPVEYICQDESSPNSEDFLFSMAA
jgi:hypothetical protein